MEFERFKSAENVNTWDPEKKETKSNTSKRKGAKDLGKIITAHDSKEKSPNAPLTAEQVLLGDIARNAERDNASPEDAKEAKSSSQEEQPLEELSKQEETETAQRYVEERLHELADTELEVQENEPITIEHTANVSFLASLRERLSTQESAEEPLDSSIQEAYQEALQDANEIAATSEVVHDAGTDQSDQEMERPTLDSPSAVQPNYERQAHEQAEREAADESGGTVLPTSGVSLSRGGSGVPITERTIPLHESRERERDAVASGLLVGGVVGYLIGRRRGRIKTEKRMEKVQKKLETQVRDVQERISTKEWQLREAVRHNTKLQLERDHAEVAAKNAASTTRSQHPEYRAASAGVLHESRVSYADQPSVPPEQVMKSASQETAHVPELDHESLLEISGKISVGESSLRRVYEARLVDEAGLRRLVHEHAAGHDIRRALAREFLIKELRFERDPQMAQTRIGEALLTGGGVQHGSHDASTGQDATQGGQAPAGDSTSSRAATIRRRASQPTTVSPLLTIMLTLLLIGLAAYALWLTFTR